MAFSTHRVDGELGRWTVTEWRPPYLGEVVERLWHFTGRTAHPRERVLPNGLLELVVHLEGRYDLVRNGIVECCAPVGISGVQTGPLVVQGPPERTTVLGLQFTPVGAYRVLDRPLHELTGLDVDLGDLVGSASAELAERCAQAADARACLRAAGAWVEARIARGRQPAPPIRWIAETIRRRHGNVAIGALRDATGFTAAKLASLFREQIGVTPKTYARIHRFLDAASRLRRGGDSLTQVALAAGYYDQPHLTAEFHDLCGLTPAAYASSMGYDISVNLPER
jgi:methylphosphotriester-DNA--protein-cysteine methyltransferase